MFTLSQMNDGRKIIKLFSESIAELFQPFKFTYSEQKPDKAFYFEKISSRDISYGYLVCNAKPPNEIISTLQNAVQMLAVILDRLHIEEELQSKARSFESVAKKRLDAIKANVTELENSRKESLNLITDLKKEITERIKIENALRESETRFQSIVENSFEGIGLIDDKFTFSYANENLAKLFGYPLNEIVGSTFMKFFAPESRELVTDSHIRRKKEEQIPSRYEVVLVRKSGEKIFAEISASTFKNIDDEHQIMVQFIDITEGKKAEEEIRASEERYRSLFENMLEGYAYCKILLEKGKPKDFIYLDVNQKFEELTGLKNVIGKKVSEVIPGIEKTNQYLLELYGRVAMTGNPERFEVFLPPLEMWFSISVYSNQREYFIAVFDVITERKKTENELKKERDQAQKYLDIAGVMFASINTKGEIMIINKKGCEILGYDDAGELIGKSWLDVCLPESVKKDVKNIFKEQMTGNIKALEYYENPVITKSGDERLIAFHNTVLLDPDGQITGVLFSGEDITEREKAKKSLLEIQHHLTNIYNTVGDVIYYLSIEGEDHYRFVSVNEMFCHTTGLTMEQIVGKSVDEVIPEPSLKLVLANYKKAIEEKSIVRWKETTPYPDGVKIGDVSIAPVFDQQGNCSFLVGSVHDITEQKTAEEEIKKLNEELEQKVLERTSELEKANQELEELNDVFVGREMRIIELKEEVERLKDQLKTK